MDHNEKRQISEYMPDEATVEGDCRYEDNEIMTIRWPGHKMLWYYGKVNNTNKIRINILN